jgi:zinc protease
MTLFRSVKWIAPAFVAAFLFHSPAEAIDIQRVVSPGGLEAWLVEDHTNPIIAVDFAFRGGASLDPDGKTGLAHLASTTLDEGAGDLDSQAFQRRLEDLAVKLGFSTGRDSFGGNLKTLTKNRDEAFRLLRLAITEPRFDDDPVARMKSQILAGLRAESERPNVIARRTLSRTLFPGHPYGRPVKGTLETVAALTPDDLRGFVRQRLARDTLLIGVVGDITAAQLALLLDSTFGALPEKATPWEIPEITPAATGETIVVEKAVPQSAIVFAHGGIKRNHPDYYAATIMDHVLGGGSFTARLYEEVREKRGLAYSIYSTLYPLDHAALILGAAGTANARVSETLEVVRAEWRRMAEKGMTAAELKDAKTFLTGSFPLRFSSSGRIASILMAMQIDDLGIDYLDKRNGYMEAVTLEQVNRVAGQLLRPDELTVVVVGKPNGIK